MSNQMKLTHCVWISTSKPPAPVQPEIGGFLWGQPPGQNAQPPPLCPGQWFCGITE